MKKEKSDFFRGFPTTTGIGSLPFLTVDQALAFSFRLGIPFLPQMPIRNPWEYMIPNALEGMPGIEMDSQGRVTLEEEIWQGRGKILEERLNQSFLESPKNHNAFINFEPSSAISSCWQAFLWELSEKKHSIAKIQIAGPITAQWVVLAQTKKQDKKQRQSEFSPLFSTQIFKLILARSLAMIRALTREGITPLLFLDEPGLFAFDPENPVHRFYLEELKIFIQTIKKENSKIGIHCCSAISWDPILSLGFDFLSIDTELSLSSFLREKKAADFIFQGGNLALGVIPSQWSGEVLQSTHPEQILDRLTEQFEDSKLFQSQNEIMHLLRRSLITPACGLAFHSTSNAEFILSLLLKVQERIH